MRWAWLLAAGLLPLTTGAQTAAELAAALRGQLARTAEPKPVYSKRVAEVSVAEPKWETQRFRLLPGLGDQPVRMASQDKVVGNFDDELAVAVEYVATDPRQRDYFTLTQVGDTLVARRKPEARYRTNLLEQRLVVRKLTGSDSLQIAYLYSDMERRSSFYSSRFTVAVSFDDLGRYQRHVLDFRSSLFLLGDQGDIRIEGQLLP
ncbi:MAG: hypothetical protein SFY70_08945 [Bacteroidia bacterium]|nr:hypothetical protein [Bacteroidia bacterium]